MSLRKIIESYDPNTSLAEASTPPSSWYVDSRVLELERNTVFASSWQVAVRADQVREAGHYVTSDLAGEPILLVRASDGILRGFFNVCRHHAAAVMTQPEGKTETLRCPYHGWTYNLEGALILTPEFAGARNFERSANGLIPVQTGLWEGLVFVRLSTEGSSLENFLGSDLARQFRSLGLEKFHWMARRTYTLNCNWKVFIDNYLDGGYHLPHLHRGLSSVLDPTKYSIETGERFCLQSCPISAEEADAQTAAVRGGERALYYWIYPNLMINCYERVMDTNIVRPLGVNRTEVVFDFYFTDVSESARESNLKSIAVSERIQAEDVAICESVQRGLQSRAYTAGRLSVRREAGEHLFHRLLYADLKRGLVS
ncbi:MAG TPA: aromatic ring-hydroxylating dioxygenase subunit alpha [Candidatus Binatia bacterium]|nr:aromatic ring-hydroxylating dioxygenase subunit alpha [Candidatus Binatia bacterium]